MSALTINDETTNYYYDHSKNRVAKVNAQTNEFTLYPSKYFERKGEEENIRYVFLGNQRLAIIDNEGAHLNFADHLNSSSVTTDADGNITNLIDYLPYGSDRVNVQLGNFDNKYKFTDKERDNESSLDYFGARYYAAAIGRFTQSDPLALYITNEHKIKQEFNKELVDILADPQLLNAYSYSKNNPIVYYDPSGNEPVTLTIAGISVSVIIISGVMTLSYELIPGVQEAWTKVITDTYEAGKALIKEILEITKQAWAKSKIAQQIKPIQEHFDKLDNSNPNDPNWKKWIKEIKDKIKIQWDKVKYLKGETRERIIREIKETEEKLKQYESIVINNNEQNEQKDQSKQNITNPNN